MVEIVGTSDKIVLGFIYFQLHFHNNFIVIKQVYENIFVSFFQPILDSNNFENFWVGFADPENFFVQCSNFWLFGGAFTP